jgi:hypothetical protein
MKKDLTILLLASIALFLAWNARKSGYTASDSGVPVDTSAAVPPEITMAILAKLQSLIKDSWPIDTMFVNPQSDGSYKARVLMFNTKHFFGTQYDVQANVKPDGTVDILEQSETSQVDTLYGYKPDKYQNFEGIQQALDNQLKASASKPIPEPLLTRPNINTRE